MSTDRRRRILESSNSRMAAIIGTQPEAPRMSPILQSTSPAIKHLPKESIATNSTISTTPSWRKQLVQILLSGNTYGMCISLLLLWTLYHYYSPHYMTLVSKQSPTLFLSLVLLMIDNSFSIPHTKKRASACYTLCIVLCSILLEIPHLKHPKSPLIYTLALLLFPYYMYRFYYKRQQSLSGVVWKAPFLAIFTFARAHLILIEWACFCAFIHPWCVDVVVSIVWPSLVD